MVYFSEFEVERRKRDINDLENQISGQNNKTSQDSYDLDKMLVNDKIKSSIWNSFLIFVFIKRRYVIVNNRFSR